MYSETINKSSNNIITFFHVLTKCTFHDRLKRFQKKVVTKEFDKYNLKGFKYRAHNGYDNYILV